MRVHAKRVHTKKIMGGMLPKLTAGQMDSIKIQKLAGAINQMSLTKPRLSGKKFML